MNLHLRGIGEVQELPGNPHLDGIRAIDEVGDGVVLVRLRIRIAVDKLARLIYRVVLLQDIGVDVRVVLNQIYDVLPVLQLEWIGLNDEIDGLEDIGVFLRYIYKGIHLCQSSP